jgi:aminocarboxymuconate-semialdehyde decarboxylase
MTDSAATTQDPVVDVHAHVNPQVIVDAARRNEPWMSMELGFADDRLTWVANGEPWAMHWNDAWRNPALRLETMDNDGVDVQLVSLNPAMFSYSISEKYASRIATEVNDGIADIVSSASTRFRGLAHLSLQDPKAAVKELERAVGELGMVGAGVGTNVAGANFDAPELFPVFEAAADLGVMIFVHPAADRFPQRGYPHYLQNLIGHPVETAVTMATLIFGGVFERLPGLRVCFAHGGGYGCMGLGRYDHGRRVREECQQISGMPTDFTSQIWVDSLTHSHVGLRFLLDQVGPGQVVLGTDFPADMGQVAPLAWLEAAPTLSDDERRAIRSGNVQALLGAKAEAVSART